MVRIFDRMISFLSFEHFLNKWPNGGTVIVLRSFCIALLLYFSGLGLRNMLDPTRTWTPSFLELRLQALTTFHWFGTVFAAIYVALYSRFAAQYNYLASLYNQIKATECKDSGLNAQQLADWKAAFIEDARELHLANKPHFASVILHWAAEEGVKKSFEVNADGGPELLAEILNDATSVRDEWLKRTARSKTESIPSVRSFQKSAE
jgi:hypothetical protein